MSAGALVGLLAGGGLLAVLSWWWDRRPLPLLQRIGPYLGAGAPALTRRPDPTIGPAAVRTLLGRRSTSDPSLAALLARAGRHEDVSAYRVARVGWAGAAAVGGLLIGLMAAPDAAVASAVLGGTFAVAGWWGCDARLRRQARDREWRMAAQLPLLADLVALGVTAGTPPVGAMEAAAEALPGPLADEVAAMAADVRAGLPADAALRALADRTALPGLRRLVDALLVAMEHGTPVAGVARAQAEDLRVDERRRLMESAGRKDIAMLVPIVALVLPSVVLVALYPGLQSLRLVVP